MYAVSSFLSTLRNVCQQLLQERVTNTIQLQIMDHAARLDLSFFEDSTSYDLLRRAQQGASTRPLFMVSGVFGLIQTAIAFGSMIFLLVGLSPLLALIALISPIPAFIADTRYGWRGYSFARWASPIRRRMDYVTTLVTTDSYAKEVKLFGLGPYFIDRFRQLATIYQDRQRRIVVTRYFAGFIWSTLTILAGSLTYLYVALQAVAGRLTLGDLTLFTQAASSVQISVQGLLAGFGSMYENQLYLNDLFDLLATPYGIEAPPTPTTEAVGAVAPAAVERREPTFGEVAFEHVTFAYPGSGREALHDVSLRIAAGRDGCRRRPERSREVDPDQAPLPALRPDRGPDPARWRRHPRARAGGRPPPDRRDVPGLRRRTRRRRPRTSGSASSAGSRTARRSRRRPGRAAPTASSGGCRTAGTRRWASGSTAASSCPAGSGRRSPSAERSCATPGSSSSTSPTSALDAQAEFELFARLRRLAAGRTAIYISHRFSTVRQADRILFLEHGALVEEGTHEELMALGGRYARLFTLQAAAYTGASIEGLVDMGGIATEEDVDPDADGADGAGGRATRGTPRRPRVSPAGPRAGDEPADQLFVRPPAT